jgi:hypothetical protein
MKNLSGFGSALVLAAIVGAFPLVSANADKASQQAAKAAYEEAKTSCNDMSNRQAKAECLKLADQEFKVALQKAMKK